MRSTILTTALIGALAILPVAAAQADFTGTWVLDPGRSEGLPDGMEQTMTVKQSGDRIEIETHLKTPMGEQRIPDVYVLDGKETDYRPPVIGDASATGRRTSRWSADRNGFESTERATLEGPDGEVTVNVTRKWTLAADTLTVQMTGTGPQGEIKSTRVFTRKSAEP